MKKEITKIENKKSAIQKECSQQEVIDFAIKFSKSGLGILKNDFRETWLPKLHSEKEDSEAITGLLEKTLELSLIFSLDSGQALIESVNEKHKNLSLEMKESLEAEFDCVTPSGKALVDLTVNAYVKKMSCSHTIEAIKLSQKGAHIGYLNFLSREVDRAHRQFLSGIETLKFMKQPTLKINLKAENAFIGDNQQFNSNKIQNNENNEPE